MRCPAARGRGYTAVVRLRRVLLAGIVAALVVGAGCEKPLLAPDEDRSPFDRYDGVRNQRADQNVMDEFGHRKPNLRERLMPKN